MKIGYLLQGADSRANTSIFLKPIICLRNKVDLAKFSVSIFLDIKLCYGILSTVFPALRLACSVSPPGPGEQARRGRRERHNAVLTTFVFIVPKMCDLVCDDNNGDSALCSSDLDIFILTQLMFFLSTLLRG